MPVTRSSPSTARSIASTRRWTAGRKYWAGSIRTCAESGHDRLPADLAPPHRRRVPAYGPRRGAAVCAPRRAPRHDLLRIDRRLDGGGNLLLAVGRPSLVAADRARALLCPALVQHARRHGGARVRQGEPA